MTWNLSTDQKERFLELMDNLGAHSTYYVNGIAEELLKCGLPTSINIEENCLLIGSKKIFSTQPEWGNPGIHPTDVLLTVINHFEFEINSNMTGKGFYHRDMLHKLAIAWNIDKKYL